MADFGSLSPEPVDVDLFNDWVSRAAKQAWGAIRFPGEVYRSQEPVTSAEMVGPAADLAGMLMGGAPVTAQPGAVGIFGGRLAKTADHAALARAEDMAAKGASREQIWNDTGWFQGADRKWRFEIPDNASGLSSIGMTLAQQPQGTKLGTVLMHPDLGAAYPDMMARPFRADAELKLSGVYDRAADTFAIKPSEGRSVTLHEAQHGVQRREGFTNGGRPETAMQAAKADELARSNDLSRSIAELISENPSIGEKYRARNRAIIAKDFDAADRLESELYADLDGAKIMALDWERSSLSSGRPTDAQDAYERIAGEVEARNVQKRMNMTPAERRATPPWLTEDVPYDQQIVRFK